jgi:ubiquinol-cytochrome c reductase cytochrome b subunit
MRLIRQNVILSQVNEMLGNYPSPTTITYFWNFGVLSAVFLVSQIITGILLVMHYTPNIDFAFVSVEHIMRDVNYGWLLRYLHSNGASMFFVVLYIHMFRGLYYGSYLYPRQLVWSIGVIIYLCTMAAAFFGYVLPWGQMSFWGATVITNFFSAFPIIGESIVHWLWGGFSVDNATLSRFFSLHYFVPFVIAALSGLHLVLLHIPKSNNPIGTRIHSDFLPFHPYFSIKDMFGIIIFFIFFSIFIFYYPNMLGHPDNYTQANPMVTPSHIVPEWYFLPFYAILRAVPNKLGGVLAMFASICILFILPILNKTDIRSGLLHSSIYRTFFWLFVSDTIILGWIGGNTAEAPYILIGKIATISYFGYFLFIIPLLSYLDRRAFARE